jgi:hypothetical protein
VDDARARPSIRAALSTGPATILSLGLLLVAAAGVAVAAPAVPSNSAPSTKTAPATKTAPSGKNAPSKGSSTDSKSPPGTAARTATFSFVCATPAVLLPAPVKQVVAQLTRAHKTDGVRPWGDRAVSLRLRKDHAPVYFVPLSCGVTGNCTWGVVDSSPAKSLGVFAGAVVKVETAGSGWPPIQVFTSGAGGESRVETLRLMDGQYRAQASAGKPAATTVAQLQSCMDNASCCPRLGGAP